jgi:hypothetical protein
MRARASRPSAIALGSLFGAEAQLTRVNPSFGDGVPACGRYFAASFAEYAIGDYMTEAVSPAMLHQAHPVFPPRNRRFRSPLGYAPGQILRTRGDSGHEQFNFSEIAGNSTAVAISMARGPDNRTTADAVSKPGSQLGIDMTSNILKEFWPALERRFACKPGLPRVK